MPGSQTAAGRRYIRRFTPTIIAYVVAVFGATYAVNHFHPQGTVLIALAILPALPIIGVIAVIALYVVEETDEYLRQRVVASMLFGTGLVLAASAVLGFLQIYGVIDKVDVFWGFPAWCVAWGAAQCWMWARDRAAGGAA